MIFYRYALLHIPVRNDLITYLYFWYVYLLFITKPVRNDKNIFQITYISINKWIYILQEQTNIYYMKKEVAQEIANNTLQSYKELFRNTRKGAFLTMCKNAKNMDLKSQVLWLVGYCEKNSIELKLTIA